MPKRLLRFTGSQNSSATLLQAPPAGRLIGFGSNKQHTHKKLGNYAHPECAEALATRMQVLFVEEHLGLGTGRFLWSHNDAGLLADVVVQQLAVGRHGKLALHSLVIVGTRPVCGKC